LTRALIELEHYLRLSFSIRGSIQAAAADHGVSPTLMGSLHWTDAVSQIIATLSRHSMSGGARTSTVGAADGGCKKAANAGLATPPRRAAAERLVPKPPNVTAETSTRRDLHPPRCSRENQAKARDGH
jgi:hypothetical protein